MRFGKRGRDGKSCFVLILKTLFDDLVQFLIRSSCLCSVKITASNDVRIGRIKIQGIGDVVKIAQR